MAITPTGLAATLLTVAVVMLTSAWIAVVARVCVRRWIKGLGVDDYLMCIGLILHTVTCQAVITSTFNGVGTKDDELNDYYDRKGRMWFFFFQFFYCLSTIAIKSSICVGLLRIATQRRYIYSLYAIICFSFIGGTTTDLALLTWCKPVAAQWDPRVGKCADTTVIVNVSYFISAISIGTDWACAILPAFILWDIHLRRSVKISLIIILAMGVIASTATIVRLKYLTDYNAPNDYLYRTANIPIWSVVETGIGITAGSLGTLRPLLRFMPFLKSSHGGSGGYRTGGTTTLRTGNKFSTSKPIRNSHRLHSIDVHTMNGIGGGGGTGVGVGGVGGHTAACEGNVPPGPQGRKRFRDLEAMNSDGSAGTTDRSDTESERHILKETTITITSDVGPLDSDGNSNRDGNGGPNSV